MTNSKFSKAYQEICHELWWVYPIFFVTQIKENLTVKWLSLLYHIQEIAGSNHGPDAVYCELRVFPGHPQGKFRNDVKYRVSGKGLLQFRRLYFRNY
jgi:hypothetical protein